MKKIDTALINGTLSKSQLPADLTGKYPTKLSGHEIGFEVDKIPYLNESGVFNLNLIPRRLTLKNASSMKGLTVGDNVGQIPKLDSDGKLNEDIYVKSFILPIKDNTGNIIEYMVLQTDITISSNNKYDLKDFSIIKCDEDKNINFIDPNIKKYFVNPLIKLNIKDEIISELSNNNIIQDILIIEDTKITCILIPIINKQQLKEIILVVKSIEIIEMNENKIFIDDINKCINI